MDKLQQELKDKEVENRIAGKKGDQLVRVCLFARFAFPLNLFCNGCCLQVLFYFVFLLLVLSFFLSICVFFLCFVLFCFEFVVLRRQLFED